MRTDLFTELEEPSDEAQARDIALRPGSLAEFMGQDAVREKLSVAIAAARQRGEALDHLILHGPPGLGKTTIAGLIANEMGTTLRTTSGLIIEKAGDLVGLLTSLMPGDVLFIDEIHRLRQPIEEFLYPAMEDRRIDIRRSDAPASPTITIPLQPFTLVGATTRFGSLSSPMRGRFGMVERLDYYSVTELRRIVSRTAQCLGIVIDADAASLLAERSRGTPRTVNRLLRRARDVMDVEKGRSLTRPQVERALSMLQVDAAGLDESDRSYLERLVLHFGGGPVGLSTIAVALSEDVATVEEVIEPFLIRSGFLMRTPRGRVATPAAFRHLGVEPPAQQHCIASLPAADFRKGAEPE